LRAANRHSTLALPLLETYELNVETLVWSYYSYQR